ncbi:cupin domain-containing protein [Spirilliplanes yamanashiensis]|uniref:LuxR family transcriptional regulator n=1 Tax=Spirilliplanes yamanashiensis TaxID=42233 RepID=A0A8J3Y754_9ACTN|nr:cupin domain-containing protein [Spirilliplanes yamanashiensis]MDP9817300.1 quercetin dioxygenase-like cupin family protein [Spirilliplanes yamanashiensis]GIJ03048.1 LuxR family transcriptional regulator [Spirilliplanes yamanashiensis]
MTTSSLPALADRHLAAARAAAGGRSAETVYGGHDRALRHTLIALAAGRTLAEHENPGEATVHVLRGRVRLAAAGGDAVTGAAGDLLVVPAARHTLEALDDAVVLLTVGLRN